MVCTEVVEYEATTVPVPAEVGHTVLARKPRCTFVVNRKASLRQEGVATTNVVEARSNTDETRDSRMVKHGANSTDE